MHSSQLDYCYFFFINLFGVQMFTSQNENFCSLHLFDIYFVPIMCNYK